MVAERKSQPPFEPMETQVSQDCQLDLAEMLGIGVDEELDSTVIERLQSELNKLNSMNLKWNNFFNVFFFVLFYLKIISLSHRNTSIDGGKFASSNLAG